MKKAERRPSTRPGINVPRRRLAAEFRDKPSLSLFLVRLLREGHRGLKLVDVVNIDDRPLSDSTDAKHGAFALREWRPDRDDAAPGYRGIISLRRMRSVLGVISAESMHRSASSTRTSLS
jgi:hypothetical protein